MKKLLQALKRDERGVSAVEYAILAGILLVIIVGGVAAFGENIADLFATTSSSINEAVTEASSYEGTPTGG